jgi:hypothetical protein
MSPSKSKCWYSNNCLHFLTRTVPLNRWTKEVKLEQDVRIRKKSFDKSEGKTIMKIKQKHIKLNVWPKKIENV